MSKGGEIYLEEGWHSIEGLKDYIAVMESRAEQLAKDMKKTNELLHKALDPAIKGNQ